MIKESIILDLLNISRITDTDKLHSSLIEFNKKHNSKIEISSEFSIDYANGQELKYFDRKLRFSDLNRVDLIISPNSIGYRVEFKKLKLKFIVNDVELEYYINPSNI